MPVLTRSARRVREAVIEFAKASLPPALAEARAEWGLSRVDLPDPLRYDPYEPRILEETPRISVALLRSRNYRRTDPGGYGEHGYQVRHQVTVYAWLKLVHYAPVQELRDDYATVLAGVFLDQPSLGFGPEFRVDEGTMEVSYSDATQVKGDRFLAGVSVSFQVEHDETVRRVPVGVAEHLGVAATVLPAHPGAD